MFAFSNDLILQDHPVLTNLVNTKLNLFLDFVCMIVLDTFDFF